MQSSESEWEEEAIERERERVRGLSGKGNCGKDEAKFVLINTFIVNAAEVGRRRESMGQ